MQTDTKALPTATLLIQNKGVEWYGGIANMMGVMAFLFELVLGDFYKS